MKNLFNLFVSLGLVISLAGCATSQSSPVDYDINRFSEEIKAFEDFDKTARYRPGSVVFTGSSSIRFWASLNEDMAPVPCINRGFGGSTLPEVNHYYDRIITKFQPSIIVLYCGENDIAMGRSAKDVLLDYKAFLAKTNKSLPDTKVIYLSMKPSPSRWPMWDEVTKGNQMIKEIADKDDKQYFIEVSEKMLGNDGQPKKSIFIQDMLHLNASGYVLWKEMIQPLVHKVYNGN